MTAGVDDLRQRLEGIAEELADLALDRLRAAAAAADGGPAAAEGGPAVADERRLTRARRAVEKAAALLAEEE